MPDFIFFMHNDAKQNDFKHAVTWDRYIRTLQEKGVFQGGSSIGTGLCKNKSGSSVPLTHHLVGFIRIHAENFDHASALLEGNPVFEAGGTVEIRELLQD